MIEGEKVTSFFDKVIKITGNYDDIFLVLVTHLVQDRRYFVDSLAKVAEVGLIIPKPNSIVSSVEEDLSKNYKIFKTTREEIDSKPSVICKKIEKLRGHKKIIILDIGGYFSGIAQHCKKHFGEDLLGIVEDTENGHQKYAESHTYKDVTVFSVARSPLKNTEDFLVGLSICFSAESVMREVNEIFTGRKALVLGYGKIGYSIAKHLAERNISVYVYDINPLRLIEAKSHGHGVLTKDDSLRIADVVFCATGQKSIVGDDIYLLKNDCIIFTATSSDDELSLPERITDYEKVEGISENVTSLTTKRGNRYHLCNSGNAVNFLHGASVGPFIFLVQSEIIMSIRSVVQKGREQGEIFYNLESDQKKLASAWLEVFSSDL